MEDLRALVIDDIAGNRILLNRILSGKGINVEEAETCAQGIGMLAGRPGYHLVVTDLTQTPKNGVDVVRAAREINQSTEAYIMTAGSDIPGLMAEARREVDEDHFLEKPVNMKKLYGIVDRLYQKFENTQL